MWTVGAFILALFATGLLVGTPLSGEPLGFLCWIGVALLWALAFVVNALESE